MSVLALDIDAVLDKKSARPCFVRLKVVFVADRKEAEDGVESESGGIMLFLELDGTCNVTGHIIYVNLNS
jgi:hypothetical protein